MTRAQQARLWCFRVDTDTMAPAHMPGDHLLGVACRKASPNDDYLFADVGARRSPMILRRCVAVTETHWHVVQYDPPMAYQLARSVWRPRYRVRERFMGYPLGTALPGDRPPPPAIEISATLH